MTSQRVDWSKQNKLGWGFQLSWVHQRVLLAGKNVTDVDKFWITRIYKHHHQVSKLWKSQTALCSLRTPLPFIICWLLFPSPGPVRQNRVASVPQISFESEGRGWKPAPGCQRASAPAVDARVRVCAPSKCRWRAVNQPLSRGTSLGFALRGVWEGRKKRGEQGWKEEEKGKLERHPLISNSEQKLPRARVCLF